MNARQVRQSRTLRYLVIGIALSFFLYDSASAEVDESSAKSAAQALVRTRMGLEASHHLRATRREDWEDDLFHLQVKVNGKIAKAAYFFEVTEIGYFVLSPDEVVGVYSTHGESRWTVAVSKSDGKAFGLYVFPDAEAAFNKLVIRSQLAVSSEADAEAIARLFFSSVRDPRDMAHVYHSRQLRHWVEDYYFSKHSEPKAESLSAKWWRGFVARKLSNQLGISSTRTREEYTVSIPYVRSLDRKTPQLVALSLKVKATGECETIGTKLLYGL